MTDIIITGYPKSGNTWVTRLVAELVGCPVAGLWRSSQNEMAREGRHRTSRFQCFKAHHSLPELLDSDLTGNEKIIYVIRDPRDIVISGAHFFPIDRWPRIGGIFITLPIVPRLYRMIVNPVKYRIARMTEAVLFGSQAVHVWLRIPWKTHYKPYLEHDCIFVKYEDLLSEPERECKRILDYLGLQRQDAEIHDSIERQSFKKKKEHFLQNSDRKKAKFLRAGQSGQWKNALTREQKKAFLDILSDDLAKFGYPTDADN